MSAVKMVKTGLKKLSIYDGATPAIAEIRNHFEKFEGGSVDLCFRDDAIATLTINNPNRRNAVSGKMFGDFLDAVERLEKWEGGKAVILMGFGGNFCSGGDLNMARKAGNAEDGYKMATIMDHVLTRFQTLPLISLAVIEGCGALGGGAEISVACDYRLVSSSCQGVGFVQGRMGIIPAWGGTPRLISAVGRRKALEILCTSKVYPPLQLKQLGLADEIIPEEKEVLQFAIEWLRPLIRVSSNAIHGIKMQVLTAENSPEDSDLCNRIFAPFWGCEENKAALEARLRHTTTS